MGLQEVQEEVLRKAQSEADRVEADAHTGAVAVLQKARDELKKYKKKTDEELQLAIELFKRKELTQAKLSMRNARLGAKKEAIEEAFSKALEKLNGLQDSQRGELVQKLVAKAQKEIDIATVYCNKKDKKLVSGYSVEEIDRFGVIAENKDGTVRVDYCFDTLLEQLKNMQLSEVSKRLFDE